MSAYQLNNSTSSNSGEKVEQRNTSSELRKVSRGAPASALNEGGIVLSGAKAVDFQAAERFRILRARIERMNLTSAPRHVIAVTSAVPEEGKSLIAANLARALAMDPRGKTILIDGDLRKPAVHRYFQIPFSPGLSDALVGNKSLASVIQSVEPGLDVITAGSPVIDATRAVELPQLAVMIEELKKHYRYIVIDCPPVLLCPEPLTLSTLAQGTIMVVRAWRTHKKLVRDAVNLLGKERFLGVIVNDARDVLNEYGYYGYYGYDNRNPSKRNSAPPSAPSESVGKISGLKQSILERSKGTGVSLLRKLSPEKLLPLAFRGLALAFNALRYSVHLVLRGVALARPRRASL